MKYLRFIFTILYESIYLSFFELTPFILNIVYYFQFKEIRNQLQTDSQKIEKTI